MENLTRYNMDGDEDINGGWVRFSDIKEFLQTATNTARDEICPVCTGDGIGADASGWVKCPTCNGTGKLSPIA